MPEGFFEAVGAFHIRTFLGIAFFRRYFRLRSFLEGPNSEQSLSAAAMLPDEGAAVARMLAIGCANAVQRALIVGMGSQLAEFRARYGEHHCAVDGCIQGTRQRLQGEVIYADWCLQYFGELTIVNKVY